MSEVQGLRSHGWEFHYLIYEWPSFGSQFLASSSLFPWKFPSHGNFRLPTLWVEQLLLIPRDNTGRAECHFPTPPRPELHSPCAVRTSSYSTLRLWTPSWFTAQGFLMLVFLKQNCFPFDSYYMSDARGMLVCNRSTKLTRTREVTDNNNTLQAENTEAQKVVTEWQRVPAC